MEQITTITLSQHGPFAATMKSEFFRDPARFIKCLEELGDDWLRWTWKEAAQDIPESESIEQVDLPPDSIAASTHDLGNGVTVTVITLPKPIETIDAYFIAFVVPPPHVRWRRFSGAPTPGPRFFSLEHMDSGGVALSISEEGQRPFRSYGSVAEPTTEAFVAGVAFWIDDHDSHVGTDG